MIETARKYVGSSFRHGGRIPEMGLDCAGLIAVVLTDLGIPFEDVRSYGFGQDNMAEYERCLQSCAQRVEDVATADIVLFRYVDGVRTVPCHAAIVGPVVKDSFTTQTMIHVPGGRNSSCVEEAFSEVWASRVHSAWKVQY